MSLIRITSKFFSIAPRVYLKRDSFHMETPLWAAALSLFLHIRHIEVDRKNAYVRISMRRAWFFERVRFVPFRHIRYLYYEYRELPTQGIVSSSVATVTDAVEDYRVGLVLSKPVDERVYLFRVVGEGTIAAGLVGVLSADGLFDFQGYQQQQSLGLLSVLAKLIGVPIGPHGAPTFSSGSTRSSCR